MSDYRRWYVPGGTYFFTVVAHGRRPLFATELARTCLKESVEHVRTKWPFETIAFVLLHDHLDVIWKLPQGDSRNAVRWQKIKEQFTRRYLEGSGTEWSQSGSRRKRGEKGIWQRRHWEHLVEDEMELSRCCDYIHWNPRKHGYVEHVRDWRWSTFHSFVERGEYTIEWGTHDPTPGYDDPEWGE